MSELSFQSVRNIYWKLIFYHNPSKGVKFEDGEELFVRNSDNSKFSLLGILNENYKINGYFEFYLKYIYETAPVYFVHWRQKSNPIYTEPNDQNIGYVPINVTLTSYAPFEGLAKSYTRNSTFIDGNPNSDENWWYAIGAYQYYPNDGAIPGIYIKQNNKDIGAKEVYLYVRAPIETCIFRQNSFNIHLACLTFIFIIS